jgi:hypothetical protein
MFQWVTIVLAVCAAGALLVGADQVVKYFQTREPGEVPVENQLNPSPSPVGGVASPSPNAAAGTSPAAQTFDSRFPGSSTVSPATPATETVTSPAPGATPGTAQNFSSPTVPESETFSTVEAEVSPDSTLPEETAESAEEEGVRALW